MKKASFKYKKTLQKESQHGWEILPESACCCSETTGHFNHASTPYYLAINLFILNRKHGCEQMLKITFGASECSESER